MEKTACNKLLVIRKRNIQLDLIRCLAVILVISIHFLKNTGFYDVNLKGKRLFILTIIRTYSMICVPLFLLLTGYLMNLKKLEKKYYQGIEKIILIYIIISIICLLFKECYLGKKIYILSLLDFSAAPYSWYIEMYIGLFLLIPFLNIIFNTIQKKDQQKLIITLLILTALPSIFNIFNITRRGKYDNLVPQWWISIYPITYYFIGAYLNRYKEEIKLKKLKNLILIIATILISSIFNYYKSNGGTFQKGPHVQYGAIENVLLSVLVFIFINNLQIRKNVKIVECIITRISKISLSIYLISYIYDTLFYTILNNKIEKVALKLKYYIPIVGVVFICSAMTAIFIEYFSETILKIKNKIIKRLTIKCQ